MRRRVCSENRRANRVETTAEMPGYKLFYFSARGGGERCRLAFKVAKIDFEDIRLEAGDAWAKEKACKLQTRLS